MDNQAKITEVFTPLDSEKVSLWYSQDNKGPVIIYVEAGEGKICWKDQNFCKAPLQTM